MWQLQPWLQTSYMLVPVARIPLATTMPLRPLRHDEGRQGRNAKWVPTLGGSVSKATTCKPRWPPTPDRSCRKVQPYSISAAELIPEPALVVINDSPSGSMDAMPGLCLGRDRPLPKGLLSISLPELCSEPRTQPIADSDASVPLGRSPRKAAGKPDHLCESETVMRFCSRASISVIPSACLRCIQTQPGWTAIPKIYMDCGFMGKNIDRWVFQRLLAEVQTGNIDIIGTSSAVFRARCSTS